MRYGQRAILPLVLVLALASGAGARSDHVIPGIDVLLSDSSALIAGKRVGLITNQTGRGRDGTPTIDLLARHHGDTLVALFAPEHGIRGEEQPGQAVGDTVDAATGLPIYSLYGTSRAPTAAQLAGLDVLIVDLQDSGTRTWTYVSTMVLAMRAAQAAGKKILVLDRPNPIGCTMDGPVMDHAHTSFIGMLPVPLRHGLTMGELARLANDELHIGADLVVVPMKNWMRCQWYDETGLDFVKPSPNLPDVEALGWYPGTVLFEATNLSTGRGTDDGFKEIGAPWLDPAKLLQLDQHLVDVARPVDFTPSRPGDGKYDGVRVRGLRFRREKVRDAGIVELALRIMSDLARAYPDSFRVDTLALARRLGNSYDPRHPRDCGTDFGDCREMWPRELAAFRARAMRYFLYK